MSNFKDLNPNSPETKVPALPAHQSQEMLLSALKELVEVREGIRGNKLDANVSWRELIKSGVVNVVINGSPVGGSDGSLPFVPNPNPEVVDLTPPPQPIGVATTAAITNVIISWNNPGNPLISLAEVWRGTVNLAPGVSGSNAVLIGTTEAYIYADAANASSPTYYYFVRFRSRYDVAGPYSAGVSGATSPDPAAMMQLLSQTYGAAEVYNKPYYYVASSTTIDGVTIPSGTYIKSAYIMDAAITNAKIKNLAVDDAKIVSLNVSKLITGSLSVDTYVQSTGYTPGGTDGWRINGDGNADFKNVSVRGTIVGTAGSIGGITLSANSARAGQTAFNTGTGFFLGSDGKFSVGNVSTGKFLAFDGTDLTAHKLTAGPVGLTGGRVQLGADVGPIAGHHGISLSDANFENIFFRRNDGVTFFRVNTNVGSTAYIDFNTQDPAAPTSPYGLAIYTPNFRVLKDGSGLAARSFVTPSFAEYSGTAPTKEFAIVIASGAAPPTGGGDGGGAASP